MREEFFTIGGMLARVWRPAYPLLPWALTSAMLTVAALWGRWNDGAPVEWVVLGLAAYELMIGLLSVESVAASNSAPEWQRADNPHRSAS